MIGINESGGGGEGLDLEFPQGTDKIEFLENAYFMDLISSKIKHKLTRLLTTAGAGYKAVHNTPEPLKIQNIIFFSCKNSLINYFVHSM